MHSELRRWLQERPTVRRVHVTHPTRVQRHTVPRQIRSIGCKQCGTNPPPDGQGEPLHVIAVNRNRIITCGNCGEMLGIMPEADPVRVSRTNSCCAFQPQPRSAPT